MRRRALAVSIAFALLAAALARPAPAAGTTSFDPQRGILLKGTVVTMTDAGTIVPNGNVLVRGDKIVAVWAGATPPAGVTVGSAVVIDVGAAGLIFPGMINAHNHTAYNMLSLWPAPSSHDQPSQGRATGAEPYANRYQWTDPIEYGRLVNGPKKALTESKYLNLAAEVVKYAEVKAMLGGETAFQGTPSLSATNFILVRNIENQTFGRDRISQRGLSIDDTRWTTTLDTGLLKQMRDGLVDAWIVHLAEGVRDGDRPPGDPFSSRGEFSRLRALGLLTDILGIGVAPDGAGAIAVGSHGLGFALRVSEVRVAGAPVALVELERIATRSIRDLRAAAYDPTGGRALLVGDRGEVLLHDVARGWVSRLTLRRASDPSELENRAFHDVAWEPHGSFALIAGDRGALFRYVPRP